MIMAKLFYIIGPSGAGKDSLIHYLRQHCKPEHRLVFAHRYITRDAHAGGENHVALSEAEFLQRKAAGFFAMDWHSHNTYYGIGTEVKAWLEQGLNVVVNGSRSYLSEALARFENLSPVLIHVDTPILRQRLTARGREDAEQIEKRLAKAEQAEHELENKHYPIINNNGTLTQAGEALLRLLTTQDQSAIDDKSITGDKASCV